MLGLGESMPTFEIRYGAFERTPSGVFHWFDVRCGDVEERVGVGIGRSVRRQWDLGNVEDAQAVQDIERRVAVRYLKDHLASTTTLAVHRIVLTLQDQPERGEDRTIFRVPEERPYQWKECRHRHDREGEYYCLVAKENDGWAGRTTLAICQDCGLPSTDIICSNLVHPSTLSSRGMGHPPTRRLFDAQCQLGHSVDALSAAKCVPGGLTCWQKTLRIEAPAAVDAGERSLGAETLDMIDTLNIIFREQFGVELFRLKQFRTGRVMLEPCNTEEAFVHKLEVLGDLIDLINSKDLGEAQGLKSERGSVNWLAVFLDKMAPGEASPIIQALRDIKTLRKHVAAHSAAADHFLDACGRLGIGLPIADWNLAWGRVIGAFLAALRKLQGILP